jgi:hypothetical protein
VLITTVIHGLKPGRVRRIREALQIDSRTLKRWRQWWLDSFVSSSFWKSAWARFMPPLSERTLPLSLWLRFQLEGRDRLLAVLQFLRPITGRGSCLSDPGIRTIRGASRRHGAHRPQAAADSVDEDTLTFPHPREDSCRRPVRIFLLGNVHIAGYFPEIDLILLVKLTHSGTCMDFAYASF